MTETEKLTKIIERLRNQQDNPPYKDMLNSSVSATRLAAENAVFGWTAAMSLAILIVDLAIDKDVKGDEQSERTQTI